jgi:hypothetical protein
MRENAKFPAAGGHKREDNIYLREKGQSAQVKFEFEFEDGSDPNGAP